MHQVNTFWQLGLESVFPWETGQQDKPASKEEIPESPSGQDNDKGKEQFGLSGERASKRRIFSVQY